MTFITLSGKEQFRFQLERRDEKGIIHIQEWIQNNDGKMVPTRCGISFFVDDAFDFVVAIADVVLEDRGHD